MPPDSYYFLHLQKERTEMENLGGKPLIVNLVKLKKVNNYREENSEEYRKYNSKYNNKYY